MKIIKTLKRFILSTIFPVGSKVKIIRGPLKGFYYHVSELGWSPIFGRWESEYQTLFLKVIKKGSVIYDLGANVGIHTILFSKLTGNEGMVYAFEPVEINTIEIKKNCEINNLSNYQIINKAITNFNGEVDFNMGVHPTQGGINGISEVSGDILRVAASTLDHFIAEGHEPPTFLKIDIEGEEGNALEGFKEGLSMYKPILLIELHTPQQDLKVGSILAENNYNVYRISTNSGGREPELDNIPKIKYLNKCHPHPEGIWGTVLAIHQSKDKSLKELVL